MAGVSLANGLKSLFTVLGCLVTASVIYTVATDGLPFRKELLTPWMAATLIDFYINIFAIWAWVAYKESNWITAIIWAVLLFFLGSITTCGYIVLQFLNLSTQESLQDPVYFVLLRRQKKTVAEQRRKCSHLTARILSIALGCLMLGSLIYTLVTDGSPFRRDVLTPWLSATLIDFYANVVALSVWVAYKESSWLSASFWIILLICFGRLWACIRPGSTCSTKDPLRGRKQQQQKQQPNKSRQHQLMCLYCSTTFQSVISRSCLPYSFQQPQQGRRRV